MSIQNNLTLTLQQIDSASKTMLAPAARLISDSANATVADWKAFGVLPTTGATTINLPIAQTRQVYIKNTHATAKITVTWTPNGGASVVAGVLYPGDALVLWSTGTNAAVGVSAISLTADTIGATYEMFLGG